MPSNTEAAPKIIERDGWLCDEQWLPDARNIIDGMFKPWWHDSRVATREEWLSAAQCALDGDDSDMRFYTEKLVALHDEGEGL